MGDAERLRAAADKLEMMETSMFSHVCRDTGDWEGLLDCFHPDAQITTSWFSGNAHAFIEESRAMMRGHHAEDTQKHVAGNVRARARGERGVCEYYLVLHQRRTMDGHDFDFSTWSSVVDLHELRAERWRVVKRTIIYEKDRMDPHKPGEVPASYFQAMDLSPYPKALRYHCWRNEKFSGSPPSENIVVENTARARRVREEAQRWVGRA